MVPLLGCFNLPSKAKEGRRVDVLSDEFLLKEWVRGWPMEDALEPATPCLLLRRGEGVQTYLANWLTVSAAATSGNDT